MLRNKQQPRTESAMKKDAVFPCVSGKGDPPLTSGYSWGVGWKKSTRRYTLMGKQGHRKRINIAQCIT